MRFLFSGALAAGFLASQLASAAECQSAADSPAFDVAGLKTELMYIALACDARSEYNAFINRFKTEINVDERAVDTHFSRSYGRTGQKQHDDFITNLANSQSQGGIRQGSAYCGHNMQVFTEVMALRNNSELEEYAAGRAAPPPTLVHVCAGGAQVERASASMRRKPIATHRRSS